MNKVIVLHKKEGETPLESLEFFRAKNQIYKNVKMTYAGRLDPMASGVLVVLAGEDTKNKDKYLNLDKEYDFEILFGFSTDTYDILGKVSDSVSILLDKKYLENVLKKSLKNFKGDIVQKYPIYSSKTVDGKPLFSYARSGVDVEIPERSVKVKSLKLIKIRNIKGNKLLQNINKRISTVGGDFRQKEILKIWNKKINKKDSYPVASLNIKCTSGTYVRTISHDLGCILGVPTLAFKIKRVKVGKYKQQE